MTFVVIGALSVNWEIRKFVCDYPILSRGLAKVLCICHVGITTVMELGSSVHVVHKIFSMTQNHLIV